MGWGGSDIGKSWDRTAPSGDDFGSSGLASSVSSRSETSVYLTAEESPDETYEESADVITPEEELLGPLGHDRLTFTPRVQGRPRCRISPLQARGPRLSARDWSFLPWRRNRRRRRNLNRKINYTDEGEITVPEEENKKTGLR